MSSVVMWICFSGRVGFVDKLEIWWERMCWAWIQIFQFRGRDPSFRSWFSRFSWFSGVVSDVGVDGVGEEAVNGWKSLMLMARKTTRLISGRDKNVVRLRGLRKENGSGRIVERWVTEGKRSIGRLRVVMY